MSARLMGEVFELDVGHAEQSVLLALTDHADDQGMNVYPSIGRIAWKTGYSKRQVQRIMEGLRQKGVLQVLESGSAREHRAVTYRVDLGGVPRKKPYRATPIDNLSLGSNCHQPSDIDWGASDTGTTRASDTGDTRLVTPVSPEPSGESSLGTTRGEPSSNRGVGASRAHAPEQTEIDEKFIDTLVVDFGGRLGEDRVRLAVRKAQIASGYRKTPVADRPQYLRNWLAEDALSADGKSNGHATPAARADLERKFGHLSAKAVDAPPEVPPDSPFLQYRVAR